MLTEILQFAGLFVVGCWLAGALFVAGVYAMVWKFERRLARRVDDLIRESEHFLGMTMSQPLRNE